MDVRSEEAAAYGQGSTGSTDTEYGPILDRVSDDDIIERALQILTMRMKHKSWRCSCPEDVKSIVRLRFSHLDYEVFTVLFLDNKNRLIESEEMFRGTLNGSAVYPREVAKAALRHNAGAVILVHNHPSGDPDPSGADRSITQKLQEVLGLFDIRVLDHLVVGSGPTNERAIVSFAERGYI